MLQFQIVVIKAIVAAVECLELDPLPSDFLELYQPIESLSECDLFQRPIGDLEPYRIKVSSTNYFFAKTVKWFLYKTGLSSNLPVHPIAAPHSAISFHCT